MNHIGIVKLGRHGLLGGQSNRIFMKGIIMKFMNGLIFALFFNLATFATAQESYRYSARFQEPYNEFENCLLDQFQAQSPIHFKHIEVTGPVRYYTDSMGRTINIKVVVPLYVVTDSNHPALLNLNLVAADPYQWHQVSTGGWPFFLTSAVNSSVDVIDHANGGLSFKIWQDCGNPEQSE